MSVVNIVSWQDDYGKDYINLSLEWLQKYLEVEPADLAIIEHPHEAVLDQGGCIYFARSQEKNIGTISLIPHEKGVYEIAKFSVTEACKGQHVGSLLIEQALRAAREKGAYKLILYTHHVLKPAIHLYHKYGFQETRLYDQHYIGVDIRMELRLH